MKKRTLLTLSAAVIALPAASILISKAFGVRAESPATVKMGDMVIWTAMKNGAAFTDFADYDLQVLHGNLENKSLQPFSTFTSDTTAWTGGLGAEDDNAYCYHWKLFTKNNDGIIAKITAKKALSVTMTKEVGSEWVSDARFGVYKGTDDSLSAVHASAAISGTPTSDFYTVSADLEIGQSYYFEFRFEWSDYRNMDPLPSFAITAKAGGEASSSSEPEPPSSSEEEKPSPESSSSEETPISSSEAPAGESSSEPEPEPVVPTPSDLTGQTSIDLATIAKEEALLEGDPLALDGFTLQALQGNFDAGWSKYGNYDLNGDNALLSKAGTFDGKEMASVETWRIKTTNTSFPAFIVEAGKDMKITVSHPEMTEDCWIDSAGQFFGFYLVSEGKTYTVWNRRITEKHNPANAFGGEMMLKAGDKAIWLFGSTEGDERNATIIPTFSGDSDAFDATVYSGQKEVEKESVNMWDALTKTINSNYEDASYSLFDYGFYYGSVKQMNKFSSHQGDGTGTIEDALWSGAPGSSAGFQRWQFQCSSTDDAIMKITAKENANFLITHTAIWEDAWCAENSELRFYGLASDGTFCLKETKVIKTGSKENDFGISLSLRKGEALIIDYATKNGNWYSLNYAPTVTADTSKFAEKDAIDFESARTLLALKTAKIDELNAKVDGLSESDYSTRDWGDIQSYKDDAISAIENATTEEEVKSIAAEAMRKIDAVPTAQALATHRSEVSSAFEQYYSSLNQDDYSQEDWEKIQSNYEYYKKSLASAQTMADMDKAFAAFKEKTDSIQKVEHKTGCGGNIVALSSTVAVLSLAGASVIAYKKKKKID